MFRTRRRKWALLVVGICVGPCVVAGCGPKSKLPPIAVATGLVTLDGKPLDGGTVTFIPDGNKGTTGPTGCGEIDKTGRYRIITAKEDGAIVGWHLIQVVSLDATKPGSPWRIPILYDTPEESGLAAEVKAGQVNEIPLELKSNP